MSYKWEDPEGDCMVIEGYNGPIHPFAVLSIGECADIILPHKPADVAELLAAILDATGCVLAELIFPEDARDAMRGMTVVRHG